MTDRLHITPGRFQPPHAGHGLTINSAAQAATKDKADHWIVPSRTEGNEQNPIPFAEKVGFLQRLFPGQKVIDHPDVKNLFGALRHAAKQGYKDITVHAGEGRAQEYERTVRPYIKNPNDADFDPERHLPFSSFKVVESGKRDESGQGVVGFSGTKARKSTRAQYRGMAPTQDTKLADEIYNSMRRGQAAAAKQKQMKKPKKAKKLAEETSKQDFNPLLTSFSEFAAKELKLKKLPKVYLKDPDEHSPVTSFGGYNPNTKEILLQTKNRHPMDIFRTLAHEFVHAKQHEDNKIGHDIGKEGETGSCHENEANAIAGVIMRKFGKANPKYFELEPLKEALFIVGGPCCGKDRFVKYIKEAFYIPEFDITAIRQRQPQEEKIVISAPAHDLSAIRNANEQLKELNYKTSMIFIDVEDKISKLRNEERAMRGQRVINESVRLEKYTASKNNIEEFKKIFGENMSIIDNSVNEEVKKPTGELKKACWKGYTAVGMKMKGGKKVPNCVPVEEEGRCWSGYAPVKGKKAYSKGSCKPIKETFAAKLEEKRKVESKLDKDFVKFMEQPENREWGKTSTVQIYKKMTPGQYADDKVSTAGVNVYPYNLYEKKEECGCKHEKKKIMRKRLAQEAENCSQLSTASGAVGLPKGDGIGDMFGVANSPSVIGGLTGVASPAGGPSSPYPFGTYGIAESVQKWLMKEETQKRFIRKYGNLAEQKLIETGINITKNMHTETTLRPKHFNQLREEIQKTPAPGFSADYGPSGTIAKQGSKEEYGQNMEEDWSDVKHQDPRGGLKASGVRAYRREHPGSKLKTAVREDPSKLKKGGKRWKRRKSFCSRMKGMKAKLTSAKTARDPDSRINKSLRAWNCEE